LYLRDGVWEGERLLPEGWVARATRPHIPTADGMADLDRQDWAHGYGHQFWMARHGYRGDGAYGQFCLVLPEQDAVIAATAATEQMQEYLNLVWRHLLPGFGPAPLSGRDAADATLQERLERLALPPAVAKPAPPERAEFWSAAAFTPYGGVCTDQPTLTAVAVTAGEDGPRLTLTDDGHPLDLRLGHHGWTVADEPVPTAVSGGWTDPGTLAVDVVFLETPHRLTVTCSLPDRTFTARWWTQPLHEGPLRSLRAPRGSV
jgi:hypothetical protein